jgi:hypothetical protein
MKGLHHKIACIIHEVVTCMCPEDTQDLEQALWLRCLESGLISKVNLDYPDNQIHNFLYLSIHRLALNEQRRCQRWFVAEEIGWMITQISFEPDKWMEAGQTITQKVEDLWKDPCICEGDLVRVKGGHIQGTVVQDLGDRVVVKWPIRQRRRQKTSEIVKEQLVSLSQVSQEVVWQKTVDRKSWVEFVAEFQPDLTVVKP